jgi:hypothetical protein
MAKEVLAPLKEESIKLLHDRGMMNNEKVISFHEDLVPWLNQ